MSENNQLSIEIVRRAINEAEGEREYEVPRWPLEKEEKSQLSIDKMALDGDYRSSNVTWERKQTNRRRHNYSISHYVVAIGRVGLL